MRSWTACWTVTTADRLTVWLDGRVAGRLDQSDDGTLAFRYDDDYRLGVSATPLSVSLPIARRDHADAAIRPWIDNLLPDNGDVRARWARELDERRVTAFNLLKHRGADWRSRMRSTVPGLPSRRRSRAVSRTESPVSTRA